MNAEDEAQFARALTGLQEPVPWQLGAHSPSEFAERFSLARNTVRAVRIEALRQGFPALLRLLGEEYFTALASLFSERQPPRSAVLHEYGADLAVFIEQFPPLAGWPFMADVARLEWARRCAFHAADAPLLQPGGVGVDELDQLLQAPVCWHPSVTLLRSAHPLWQLWHAGADNCGTWPAENVLVWRQGLQVMTQAIDVSTAELLAQLQLDGSLGKAAESLQPHTDVDAFCACVATLLQWQVLSPAEP